MSATFVDMTAFPYILIECNDDIDDPWLSCTNIVILSHLFHFAGNKSIVTSLPGVNIACWIGFISLASLNPKFDWFRKNLTVAGAESSSGTPRNIDFNAHVCPNASCSISCSSASLFNASVESPTNRLLSNTSLVRIFEGLVVVVVVVVVVVIVVVVIVVIVIIVVVIIISENSTLSDL